MARVPGRRLEHRDASARVSPKGDVKPAEPRYNKGGIAVVKSAESLNSWYRSRPRPPLTVNAPPSSTSTLRFRSSPLYPLVCEITRARWGPSFSTPPPLSLALSFFLSFFLSSRPRRTRRLRVRARVHVSFGQQSGAHLSAPPRPRLSSPFSLCPFFARESLSRCIPLSRTKPAETRRGECARCSLREVRILTECPRWNCCPPPPPYRRRFSSFCIRHKRNYRDIRERLHARRPSILGEFG